MSAFKNLTNKQFGRLTVIGRAVEIKKPRIYWECKCSCGNITTVAGSNLTTGRTQSCGCLGRETATTHGMSKTSEYNIFIHMINRCYNPNDDRFSDYGGRGIAICDEWRHDFMAFYNHVGARPSKRYSIDRIDNDGNYEPGNVRWATAKEQSNNNRANHNVTINGKTMNVVKWAQHMNTPLSTILMRIKRGWSTERAILKPSGKHDDSEKTINGKTMNLKRWALFANIKYNLVCSRINRGWPLEKALFHPVRKQ